MDDTYTHRYCAYTHIYIYVHIITYIHLYHYSIYLSIRIIRTYHFMSGIICNPIYPHCCQVLPMTFYCHMCENHYFDIFYLSMLLQIWLVGLVGNTNKHPHYLSLFYHYIIHGYICMYIYIMYILCDCVSIIIWLVVWNIFYFPFHIWDVILPIDELHHSFKMVN